MKIQNKKSHRKIIISVASVVVLASAIAGGYFFAKSQNFFAKKTNENLTSNSDKKDSSNDKKNEEKNNSSDNHNYSSTQKPGGTEPGKNTPKTDEPNTSNNSMTVSAVAFRSGANLLVQNIIIYSRDNSGNYQFLTGGTCTLTIGGYSASQAINPAHTGSNYTVCDNFTAPINQASGSEFTISVKSDKGQTATFAGRIQ